MLEVGNSTSVPSSRLRTWNSTPPHRSALIQSTMQTESIEFKDSAAPKVPLCPKYHPLFSLDGDLMLFCVPSLALKMTSAWLLTMFTRTVAERKKSETPPPPFPRGLKYSSTLEALFRCMICGLEIPTLDTWDTIEPVLYAAEKCDMPSPASIVWALSGCTRRRLSTRPCGFRGWPGRRPKKGKTGESLRIAHRSVNAFRARSQGFAI